MPPAKVQRLEPLLDAVRALKQRSERTAPVALLRELQLRAKRLAAQVDQVSSSDAKSTALAIRKDKRHTTAPGAELLCPQTRLLQCRALFCALAQGDSNEVGGNVLLEQIASTPLGVLAKDLSGHAPTATDAATVTLGEALINIKIEYEKALPDLAAPMALAAAHYMGAPLAIRRLEFDVVSCVSGSFFRNYFILCVRCTATFSPRVGHSGLAATRSDVLVFESMHFVKGDSHLPEVGTQGSYELQSIHLPDKPLELQCVAGTMTQLALIMMALHWNVAAPSGERENSGEQAEPGELDERYFEVSRSAFPDGAIGVLGMGGNVIGNCFVHALPGRRLVVVDVEPAVCESCIRMNTFAPVADAVEFIGGDVARVLQSVEERFFLLFLDCFDPLAGTMMHAVELLKKCRATLRVGGALAINAHISIDDKKALAPFVAVFGSGRVHAVNIRGCRQAMIVCIHDPVPERDSRTFLVGMHRFCGICDEINLRSPQLLNGLRLDPSIANTFRTVCFSPQELGGAAGDEVAVARVWVGEDKR